MIIKGYPSQEKRDDAVQQVVTVQPIRNGGHGLETAASTTAAVVASDAVEAGSTTQVLNATAHSAEAGDIIRFTSPGTLFPREIAVESVTANTITLAKPAPAIAGTGDPFDIMRYFNQTITLTGAPFTQVAYVLDAANQLVTEDTGTPANNRPMPTKLFADDGTALAFGAGVVSGGAVRNTPASDSPHLLATRHEAVGTPLSSRISDGTDFISSDAITAAQNSVATLTKALASASICHGWDGTNHRELLLDSAGSTLLSTRHETVTTPLALRLSDGTDFINSIALAAAQNSFGAVTKTLHTASTIHGWDGSDHREVLLDSGGRTLLSTRHEAVATPLASRLSDGTDFISSEAIAGAQKTVATLTKAIATLGITLGWDGATHREIAVNTSGQLTLDTRHEAVATPLSARLSDGTNFLGSEAIAAAQKTLATETAAQTGISLAMGWDGVTHREMAVDSSGNTQTKIASAAAAFQAVGKILGTALTGTYATVITAAGESRILIIANNCDQDIFVSMDGGVTDHFELAARDSISLDLGNNGLHLANGSVVQAKHAGVVPTSGSIRISAVS